MMYKIQSAEMCARNEVLFLLGMGTGMMVAENVELGKMYHERALQIAIGGGGFVIQNVSTRTICVLTDPSLMKLYDPEGREIQAEQTMTTAETMAKGIYSKEWIIENLFVSFRKHGVDRMRSYIDQVLSVTDHLVSDLKSGLFDQPAFDDLLVNIKATQENLKNVTNEMIRQI